jgi:hypothetical protein
VVSGALREKAHAVPDGAQIAQAVEKLEAAAVSSFLERKIATDAAPTLDLAPLVRVGTQVVARAEPSMNLALAPYSTATRLPVRYAPDFLPEAMGLIASGFDDAARAAIESLVMPKLVVTGF